MIAKTCSVGALSGVRILDMATVLAAPTGTALCADQGADVVKLELPDGSDPMRHLQPIDGANPLWWKVVNRGKRGITLDVRKPRGRELFLAMLPRFDVLVENFRTGTLARWGLDIETLHQANPRLVVLRLTGFGQTGPYKRRPGFARIFEAMSGFTNVTGELQGPPLHINLPVGDAVAGLFCAFAIASEIARLRGNPDAAGVEIDLAATEAMFRLFDALPVEHEVLGLVRRANGSQASYTAPSNIYRSADDIHFSLVASSAKTFARLCDAIGREEFKSDPRFINSQQRVKNMDVLDVQLSTWFGAHAFATIESCLRSHEVPFSKIYTIEDIEADEHFRARKMIIRLPDPDYGTLPAPCVVPRVTNRTALLPRTGPVIGEHNTEFYHELGITDSELHELRQQHVI